MADPNAEKPELARKIQHAKRTLPPEFEVSSWTDHDEIMGVRHKTWPLEGVQFHPESFLTGEGTKLLNNFLTGAFFAAKV